MDTKPEQFDIYQEYNKRIEKALDLSPVFCEETRPPEFMSSQPGYIQVSWVWNAMDEKKFTDFFPFYKKRGKVFIIALPQYLLEEMLDKQEKAALLKLENQEDQEKISVEIPADLEKRLNEATFKLQIQLDDTIYFISADDTLSHPQWISPAQLLTLENNWQFFQSSIRLLHSNGDRVIYKEIKNNNANALYFYKNDENPAESILGKHANYYEACDEPFHCEKADKELLISLINYIEINNLETMLANITLRNNFFKLGPILKFVIEDKITLKPPKDMLLNLSAENLPTHYEPSWSEPYKEISLFHLAIQGSTFELVEKLYTIFNRQKNWLSNEIIQGLSRKESHIISALKTHSSEIIHFVFLVTSMSETEIPSLIQAINTLPARDIQKAQAGLEILMVHIHNKKKKELQEAIIKNDIRTINLLYDKNSHDIAELINFAMEKGSDKITLTNLSDKALACMKNNIQTLKCILALAENKLINADFVNFINTLDVNQRVSGDSAILLPVMLAFYEDKNKIIKFIMENKYDLICLLLISISYKNDGTSKKMLLDYLDTLSSPSEINPLNLEWAKKTGDNEIYNKISAIFLKIHAIHAVKRPATLLITDCLNEIKQYKKVPLTEAIKKSLIEIQKICNSRYSDQSFYGNDALNRKMLLDAEIAKLLTPEVITYVFTNRAIPETKIHRNSTGLINLKDAIYFGFKEGLQILHKLPNNERSYGLKGYQEQDSNFSSNTLQIVNNICIASNIFAIETEKAIDSNVFIKQYQHIVETVNLLKKADKSDYLLFVPNYSPEEIRTQTISGFSQLSSYITALEDETLDSFCEKILNDPEAILDGVVIHLFYDRVHFEAGLEQDTLFRIGKQEYTLQDIFSVMLKILVDNPDKYLYAREQTGLRLLLVERHLKNKFKREYEQAAVNSGYVKEMEKKEIHDDTNIIFEGPKNKTRATISLENLIKKILLACKENWTIDVRFNDDDAMIICMNNETYNLTTLLKAEPDWEHLVLNPSDMDNYESFLKSVSNPPVHGHIEKSERIDIKRIKQEFPQLTLAECSAIHHYSSEMYIVINNILRLHGQSGFLNFCYGTRDRESTRLIHKYNKDKDLNPGEYPSDLNKMVIEALLITAFAAHALTRRFWYDRILVVSSLQAMENELKTMSGFLIAIIGGDDNKQIAVIQQGEIVNFDQNKNLPVINFKHFYSKIQSNNEESFLKFTDKEISVLQKSLNTTSSCEVVSFGELALDNRFLACLIQEIGEENAYPGKELFRVDKNNAFMDSYTLSIIDTLTKEGQAYRVAQGFYSASKTLQKDFFDNEPGIVTKVIFPGGTVLRTENLSNRPYEEEYLLPPGQQLLYTASVKGDMYRVFHVKPVRGIQSKGKEAAGKSMATKEEGPPPVKGNRDAFGLFSPAQTSEIQKEKADKEQDKDKDIQVVTSNIKPTGT